MARHGGGAFSGKDPTKVDRSAAYAARWVAKNVVAAGLADRFEVEVAYGIGIARPISFSVDSFGTGRIDDAQIQALVERHFDLRPASIIAALDLRRPIYRQTAAYGHFGRPDLDLPWERTDKAALLAAEAGLPEPSRSRSPRADRWACSPAGWGAVAASSLIIGAVIALVRHGPEAPARSDHGIRLGRALQLGRVRARGGGRRRSAASSRWRPDWRSGATSSSSAIG